jgi:beta-lactamase regulating signal transducer with metallopeptidase domain
MLAWMVYVIVVTLILGAAALAAERSAQIRKAPARWLWGASIIASLLLPTVISSVSIQLPSLAAGGAVQTAPQRPIPLRQITAGAVQPSAWLGVGPEHVAATPDADAILARVWGAASGLLFLAILFNAGQLYRRKRSWERRMMAGAQIYVSEDVGPAVVGLLRPCIVLPRWIVSAPEETQALVLAHEQSHLDAHDAQLLAVAIMLIVTMPWNLPLWWQLRRLRFAIEMDCDARVLRGGHDASRYGETLIMVGERQSTHFAVVAAMSESKSFLEQRIRRMLRKQTKFAGLSATAMAGLGFALAASAAVVSPPNTTPSSVRLLDVSDAPAAGETRIGGVQMKPYKNAEWNFALDIPASWNSFPAVPTNSPYEVIRFFSNENGTHGLIIFRQPHDPADTPELTVQKVQESLAKNGFSNFVAGETTIGPRAVRTLDFDKKRPDGKTWSVREYFIIDGTLSYVLGFGTTDRNAMFGLYDQMAKSFVFGKAPG